MRSGSPTNDLQYSSGGFMAMTDANATADYKTMKKT